MRKRTIDSQELCAGMFMMANGHDDVTRLHRIEAVTVCDGIVRFFLEGVASEVAVATRIQLTVRVEDTLEEQAREHFESHALHAGLVWDAQPESVKDLFRKLAAR